MVRNQKCIENVRRTLTVLKSKIRKKSMLSLEIFHFQYSFELTVARSIHLDIEKRIRDPRTANFLGSLIFISMLDLSVIGVVHCILYSHIYIQTDRFESNLSADHGV